MDKNQIKSLSGMSAIGAAQLSGFGVYLLASSTLGAITSVLGFTLPFAFNTGMSSAISFVIGPIGFLVMGVLVYRSFKHLKNWDEAFDLLKSSWKEIRAVALGDYTRGTLVFKYIAATRIVLIEDLKKQIEEHSEKISFKNNTLAIIDSDIDKNRGEIGRIRKIKIEQSNDASVLKIEIAKKQDELKIMNYELNRLNLSLDNFEKSISEKINNKGIVRKEISDLENESKLRLKKIDQLNN